MVQCNDELHISLRAPTLDDHACAGIFSTAGKKADKFSAASNFVAENSVPQMLYPKALELWKFLSRPITCIMHSFNECDIPPRLVHKIVESDSSCNKMRAGKANTLYNPSKKSQCGKETCYGVQRSQHHTSLYGVDQLFHLARTFPNQGLLSNGVSQKMTASMNRVRSAISFTHREAI